MLNIARPKDRRNGKSETQPELVAKHGDRVSRVTVVTCVGSRHAVAGMRTDRFVILVRHAVHLDPGSKFTVRERLRFETICTEPSVADPLIFAIVLVSTRLAKSVKSIKASETLAPQ